MNTALEKLLLKLGLSEKAARVYLASLELGPSAVQVIAQKAGVNRPTTYVMIEDLMESGLMSSFEKGKKRFFLAENPDHLKHLVFEEKKRLDEKEIVVTQLLGELKSLTHFSKGKPSVSYFEGEEGIHALREEVIRSGEKELLEIVPLDLVRTFVPEEATPEDLRHEIRKSVRVKTIYTNEKGKIYPSKQGNNESRYLAVNKFPFGCEIIVFGDRTALFTFSGKPTGVLLRSNEISATMRILFMSLWALAE